MILAKAGDGMLAIAIPLLVGLVVLNVYWVFRRSESMLKRHLHNSGYRLVNKQYRWLARGPFFWTTSKGQSVYRFVAEDVDGVRREGWARIGGYFFGLLSDRVDLRWDDEPKDHGGPGFPVVMGDDQQRH
jgi:hypothetical protein